MTFRRDSKFGCERFSLSDVHEIRRYIRYSALHPIKKHSPYLKNSKMERNKFTGKQIENKFYNDFRCSEVVVSDSQNSRFLCIHDTYDDDYNDCFDCTEYIYDADSGSIRLSDGGIYRSLQGIEDEFDMDHIISCNSIEPLVEKGRPFITLYGEKCPVRYDIKSYFSDGKVVQSRGMDLIPSKPYEDIVSNNDFADEDLGILMEVSHDSASDFHPKICVGSVSSLMRKIATDSFDNICASYDAQACLEMGLTDQDIINLSTELDDLGFSYMDIYVDEPDADSIGDCYLRSLDSDKEVIETYPEFCERFEFADSEQSLDRSFSSLSMNKDDGLEFI